MRGGYNKKTKKAKTMIKKQTKKAEKIDALGQKLNRNTPHKEIKSKSTILYRQ